jgi:hypothetical protein
MVFTTSNNQLRRIYQELGDIIDDCNVAGRLPDALLHRLRAIQGMLMEEMSKSRQTDSEVDLLTAELSQDADPRSSAGDNDRGNYDQTSHNT